MQTAYLLYKNVNRDIAVWIRLLTGQELKCSASGSKRTNNLHD